MNEDDLEKLIYVFENAQKYELDNLIDFIESDETSFYMRISYDTFNKVKEKYKSYNKADQQAKEAQFEQLWKMYDPFKRGKFMAKKRFMDLPSDKIEYIVYRAIAFSDSVEDKRYLPHLSTWLNQRRWEDEEIDPLEEHQEKYNVD